MSKNKKLSLEDKRIRLLEFFHEKKSVFLLKELEKNVPKDKGIPLQTIKDVLDSLVGDDLVDTDKIGTSTFFWSFPSKSYQKRLLECKNLEQTLETLQQDEKRLIEEIDLISKDIKTDDDDGDDTKLREDIMEEIAKLEQEKQELFGKLEKLKDYDPNNLQIIKNQCAISRQAIDRWTDNIFAIKSWCNKKFSLQSSEINKAFGLPEDFDYYEENVDQD